MILLFVVGYFGHVIEVRSQDFGVFGLIQVVFPCGKGETALVYLKDVSGGVAVVLADSIGE